MIEPNFGGQWLRRVGSRVASGVERDLGESTVPDADGSVQGGRSLPESRHEDLAVGSGPRQDRVPVPRGSN
jgi:hypothetical protein